MALTKAGPVVEVVVAGGLFLIVVVVGLQFVPVVVVADGPLHGASIAIQVFSQNALCLEMSVAITAYRSNGVRICPP